ncbi:MAG TPA: DNA ligase D [Candidatus Saccharimonadales bacterium]|nr:DNA ligase D [Candidatus Saccharimonadales bacterium]
MGLRDYFAKRHFNKTPEPKGAVKKTPSPRLAFVVQKHHASSLHYDFRLELDGVLKSWAVPKGPSMNPDDRHLAMEVEDHPYEYRTFEGVIPEGSYGAGNVIIWDEGTYEPRAETDDPVGELRKGLQKGHLTFILHGTKLHGEFALIKMHGKDPKAWLLVKKGDSYASKEDITVTASTSVTSGRGVDDLGAHNKLPDLSLYPQGASPWQVKPMLCSLVPEPFNREDWLFEIKWDGYRAVASKQGTQLQLYSRTGQNFSEHYPPIFEALHELQHDVILDGEIVVVDQTGKPHFEWLQGWRANQQGHLAYYVFDLLWVDGHDIRSMPLRERKKLLRTVLPNHRAIRYSDHFATEGVALFEQIKRQGLEGIVAKRADSAYREGNRGDDWLKIKTHLRQEVVIGGFTEPRGGRKHLGSLLLGVYDKGAFVYVGHSGGGIPDETRRTLRSRLEKLERKTPPFTTKPKPNAPVHWVRPEVVAEMSFTEWTAEGSMRHPKYEGLRTDKKPWDVHREKAKPKKTPRPPVKQAAANASGGRLSFTHLDKVFFPAHGYTKGDLITYYQKVAPYILPYLQDRPLSLLRQPGGVKDHGFFQKNMEHLPGWVPSADIYSESHGGNMHWMVGGDLDTLLYAVQLGSIELNPWNSRIGSLEEPDWLVIDLDPEGVTFQDVIRVALTTKQVCDEWQVPCYPKTSGKTGIHIYVPLSAQYSYDQARTFAHLLALEINRREPELTSLERSPAKRPHKIYLDYLQNRQGQTLAAPYAVRPTADASVSTPLRWEEITPRLRPEQFTIKNIPRRLAQTGDLWKPVMGKGIDLAAILEHITAPDKK